MVIKIYTKFERIVELLTILRILHTLCHAVTLTFYRFTLNFHSTSGVVVEFFSLDVTAEALRANID